VGKGCAVGKKEYPRGSKVSRMERKEEDGKW